jgi:hypothetical protein
MIQRRQEARLPLQSAPALAVLPEGLGEELHGHVAIELGIPRAIDYAHPSRAERGKDFVGTETGACFERHDDRENAASFYMMAGAE